MVEQVPYELLVQRVFHPPCFRDFGNPGSGHFGLSDSKCRRVTITFQNTSDGESGKSQHSHRDSTHAGRVGTADSGSQQMDE